MKKKLLMTFLTGLLVFGLCSLSQAGKPMTGDPPTFNGNGFPSGPHYNLLIHGKPDTFTCPPLTNYMEVTFGVDVTCTYNDKPIQSGELVGACDDKLSCTGAFDCIDSGIPKYGNVVNVPRFETDDPITIVMESGRKTRHEPND